MRKVSVAACLVAALALGGCATVTRGTVSSVSFDSVPSGAEMRTSKGPGCVTPCQLQFGRYDEFDATFTKAGFQPITVAVKTRVAGAGAAGVLGNVLVGGVVGLGVDAATGAANEHWPNPVVVQLVPLAPAPAGPRGRQRKDTPVAVAPRPAPQAPPPAVTVAPGGEPLLPDVSAADETAFRRN